MKMQLKLQLLILGFLSLSSIGFADDLKIWISGTCQTQIFSKISAPFEKSTGIKIVNGGDATKASNIDYLMDVLNEKVEAAASAGSFEEWVGTAKKKGLTHANLEKLTYRLIGKDMIVFFANKESGVAKITEEQLSSIMSGKVKNWKDLGGKNLPIKIAMQTGKPGILTSVKSLLLKGNDFGGDTVKVELEQNSIEFVEKTPGGIGFAPSGAKLNSAVLLDSPPIGRPLILINIGKPSDKIQKLVAFIRDEGSKHGVGNK